MNETTVVKFAILARALYMRSERSGEKLIRAVCSFIRSGGCDSNAYADSVCGGICPTCNPDSDKEV